MDGPPAAKKSKMDDAEASNGPTSSYAYIPTEKSDSPQFSVVFSMKEEKGALVKALELCKVSWHPACTVTDWIEYFFSRKRCLLGEREGRAIEKLPFAGMYRNVQAILQHVATYSFLYVT